MVESRIAARRLDARDVRILEILQREGRISKAALAARVNLSATPCWERLQRLERAGIIESYGAQISLKTFGPMVIVFVEIELDSHRKADFQRFEQVVGKMPEITECWAIGGGMDYLCKIVVRHLAEYQDLIDALLGRDVGTKRYYTYVVTAPVKQTPLPLQRLLPEA